MSQSSTIGIDQVHVVGSSHGGYMAIVAALRHPDRIGRTEQMGCPGFEEGMVVRMHKKIADIRALDVVHGKQQSYSKIIHAALLRPNRSADFLNCQCTCI